MVDRAEETIAFGEIKWGYWRPYKAIVSTSDTVTFDEFDSSVNLDQCFMFRVSDRSAVSGTISNNEVTITTAGLTNVEIRAIPVGVRA